MRTMISIRAASILFSLGGLIALVSLTGCGSTSRIGEDIERRVYAVDDVDEAPRIVGGYEALEQAKRYPAQAREDGAVGVIWVQSLITSRGLPTKIRIAEGGHLSLEAEAQRVVRNLRFEPARMNGASVPATVHVPVIFQRPRPEEEEE